MRILYLIGKDRQCIVHGMSITYLTDNITIEKDKRCWLLNGFKLLSDGLK